MSISAEHTLTLPWPPSVNHYWRHVLIGGKIRVILSSEGRNYKKRVQLACKEQNAPEGLLCRILTHITLFPPDKRRRDIDNSCKVLIDSITEAGVWGDDSQIDKLIVERGEVVKDGKVEVRIGELA